MRKKPKPKLSHPGEILRDEYLKPSGLKAIDLARATGLGSGRVSEILSGKRDITAETAIRLAHATAISAKFWLGLQNDYDIMKIESKKSAQLKKQTKRLEWHEDAVTA